MGEQSCFSAGALRVVLAHWTQLANMVSLAPLENELVVPAVVAIRVCGGRPHHREASPVGAQRRRACARAWSTVQGSRSEERRPSVLFEHVGAADVAAQRIQRAVPGLVGHLEHRGAGLRR